MTEVVWTLQAVQDVEAIRAFVARDAPRYADRLVETITEAVDRLETFPESGRIVPETGDTSVRELITGNYRIIYELRSGQAVVLTVHHSARRLKL